ncbi:Arc family DNA-binding protein [Herbaspirillum sp. SJZ107]|uniref:Arc family DNA-binding protein n=1 Tax=Herbaspirillum sp. SJZ107 TaxID=2572881 RepID=UPI00163B25CC|nr:Arc family DNA-binding protein [Herbaspirillum sp. SJZ107]
MPYPLRMPEGLRDRLNEQAKLNNRSLHGEIVAILQRAVDLGPQVPDIPGLNVGALADTIADRVAARLKEGI